MYLTRFSVLHNRIGLSWVSNPYRVHQRLCMAYANDQRLLFRIEPGSLQTTILVQSNNEPDWKTAFQDLEVLNREPEIKVFDPVLRSGAQYRFRLLANPIVTREGKRLGLLREEEQHDWIKRQMEKAGATLLGCQLTSNGLQRCTKNPQKDKATQTHASVLFDGVINVQDPDMLVHALSNGIGPAKGYGFGLISIAAFSGG